MGLTKEQAVYLCGGTVTDLAAAIGLSRPAVSRWAQGELRPTHEAMAIGAAVRMDTWPRGMRYESALVLIQQEIERLEAYAHRLDRKPSSKQALRIGR